MSQGNCMAILMDTDIFRKVENLRKSVVKAERANTTVNTFWVFAFCFGMMRKVISVREDFSFVWEKIFAMGHCLCKYTNIFFRAHSNCTYWAPTVIRSCSRC